ncbi:MAG: 4-hydroxy-2-oxovalerate aldolase, partial [Oscillospiraceae bacterium]
MENKNITIIDSTLRDGSHAVAHSFSQEQAANIAAALNKAGSKYIEVAHGDGLSGSSCQYGFMKHNEMDVIKAVIANAGDAKVGVLLLPGIGTIADLKQAREAGIQFVRVATHVTEADISAQHIQWAKQNGLFVAAMLMMSHMAEPEIILQEAKKFEEYGADVVYLADSAGALLPEEVTQRIKILTENLNIPVGFHAHNNLGLAIANSLAAVQAGALFIDATLAGLGASAGNAAHEVLVAVLNKCKVQTHEDLYTLMDAAEDNVRVLDAQMAIDKYALSIGYAGVYGSFF